jgi:two-component sensor histidine kinase
MNNEREESASAIQIREKKARVEKMFQLAQEITKDQIREVRQKEPNAPLERIVERVQGLGIPITAFLHEYIANEKGSSVSFHIAQSYFENLAERLKPDFISFNPNSSNARAIQFHLKLDLIEHLAQITQKKGEPEPIARKSGKITYKKEK